MLLLIFSIAYPLYIWIFLFVKFPNLKQNELQLKFGSIYQGIDLTRRSPLLYNVLFVLRRLIFAIACVIFKGNPFFQIQVLIYQCTLLIIYLFFVQPFERKIFNKLEIFNEITIVIVTYHLFVFTDFMDDPELKY